MKIWYSASWGNELQIYWKSMALYYYHAFSKDGKRQSGQLDAPSEQGVKESLAKRGLFPSQIGLVKGANTGQPWYKRWFEAKVSFKDKIMFTKQLAVLLKSGIPLLHALELLVEQFQGKMRNIIVHLKDGVKEGRSLTDGLNDYPNEFSKIYIQLVRAGEATGNLDLILKRLNVYLDRDEAIRKKVNDALREPLTTLGFIGLVVIGLLTFLVPRLAKIFTSRGGKLPLPTKILMMISNFITQHYLILLGTIILGVILFKRWVKSPKGAYQFDKLKLKIPVLKFFVRITAVVQFSRTLGMLLEGGVRLSEALNVVCDIIDNRVLADSLEKAKDSIIKEGKITQYLKQTGLFPPMAIYLIGTGEESGELAQMLQSVGDNYEEELSDLTSKLSSLIDPIMKLVTALVVGFIVIAMVMPIVGMNKLVSKK